MKTRSKWTQRMRSFFTVPRRDTKALGPLETRRRFAVEPLEDRRMLSVLFVDADATDGGDGLSWQTAYRDLQSAFDSAEALGADTNADNDIDQIWIAEGTYLPTDRLEAADPRSAAFSLLDGVTLYGGFDGTETMIAQRDIAANRTVLSGDVGVVDEVSDNAYTVVYCSGAITAGLDGLTVTGGYADAEAGSGRPERMHGAGIYNYQGTLGVAHCEIVGNATVKGHSQGGGIYSAMGSMSLTGSIVTGNSSYYGSGVYNYTGMLNIYDSTISENSVVDEMGTGGGIYNYGSLEIVGSRVSDNSSRQGGGIYSNGGIVIVRDSIFSHNLATDDLSFGGGAIDNRHASALTVLNSSFLANSTHKNGGAIANYGATDLANCTFVANSAEYGGAIADFGVLTVTNSTFVGNWADEFGAIGPQGEKAVISNSLLWQNSPGEIDPIGEIELRSTLIGVDPRFVRAPSDGGDGWGDDPATPDIDESANDDYGDLRLGAQSPAIDAGRDDLLPLDEADLDGDGVVDEPIPLDIDGNSRIHGTSVDCGAYEFQEDVAPGREAPSTIVTTAADTSDPYDGLTSIREAILHAGNGEPETAVQFAPAMEGETIVLNGSPLYLSDGICVDASMLNTLTIDANGQSRVLTVLSAADSHVEIRGLTLTGGSAQYGGGIINSYGELVIADSKIVGNSGERGGGVYDLYGTVILQNSDVSENSAELGGGVYSEKGLVTLTGSSVSGNTADYGGGVYGFINTTEVVDSTVAGNSADEIGGGIRNDRGVLTVLRSTVSENTAWRGGGAIDAYKGVIRIGSSEISNNSASRGDIYAYQSTLDVANSLFCAGGSVALCEGSLNVTGSVFQGNGTKNYSAIYCEDASFTLTNSTVSGYISESEYGAAIRIHHEDQTTAVLHNNIIAGNISPSDSPDIYGDSHVTFTGSSNLIGIADDLNGIRDGVDGNIVGTEDAPADPLFVRAPNPGSDGVWKTDDDDYGDLRLLPESPAVDAGNDALVPLDTFDLDQDGETAEPVPFDVAGNPRMIGTLDIGAYERQARMVYVDADAAAGGDGESWATAFNDLQTALDAVDAHNSEPNVANEWDQIWIAEGIYRPTALLQTSDARGATFSLLDGVTLYGGFNGSETTLDTRNTTAHQTVLSGDLGVIGDNADNAYTVVYSGDGIIAVLDGVTVSGGNADAASQGVSRGNAGGALYVVRSQLTLVDVTVTDSTAMTQGGGIYADHARLTIANSSITHNTADSGGGIANISSMVTLTDSTVGSNTAVDHGGGMYSDRLSGHPTTAVENTSFERNHAGFGGAIAIVQGYTYLTNSPLGYNSAENDGGAILIEAGSMIVYGSAFYGNTAGENAGAIDNAGSLQMNDSTVVRNSAGLDAGGIRNQSPGMVFLRDSTINDNWALRHAGGIKNESTLILDGTTVTNNRADEYAGGLWNHSGVLHVEDSHIDDNAAEFAGGVYIDGTGVATLVNSSIDRNSASQDGGGMVVHQGSRVTAAHCTVNDNSAGDDCGGIYNFSDFRMTDSHVDGNYARDNVGGLASESPGSFYLIRSSVSNNYVHDCVGGVEVRTGLLMLTDSVVSGNWAPAKCGGIQAYQGGHVIATNSTIAGNTTGGEGGGFLLSTQGRLTLVNSTLVGNSAATGGGGHAANGMFTAENSTITGNAASGEGGGVYALLPTVLNNTIIADNTAAVAPDLRADSLSGSHNLLGVGNGQTAFADGVDGNLVGTVAEPIDPRFVRAASAGADRIWGTPDDDYGDLRLRVDSPAIDAGYNGLIPADATDLDKDGDTSEPLPIDKEGNTRVDRWTVDMGAYEHHYVFGDLNRDGRVDGGDLDLVRCFWGQPVPEGSLFIGNPNDPSNRIGSGDLEIVRAYWGATDPTETAAVDAVFAAAAGGDEGEVPPAASAVGEAEDSPISTDGVPGVYGPVRAAWAMSGMKTRFAARRHDDPIPDAHDAWLRELARLG